MKCDHCENPAVVHEVVIKSGQHNEIHLCESCAREAGVDLPTSQPINKLLTQFVISQSSTQSTSTKSASCPTCGLRFRQFRHSGLLGCQECYDAFAEQLESLIERAQDGAIEHVGKSPTGACATSQQKKLVQRLIRNLDQAVAAEEYERAAELRDQLRHLDADAPSARSVRSDD